MFPGLISATRLGKADAILLAFIMALAAILAWQVAEVGDWRVDDAYITFSFATNLAQGKGPTYSNHIRVEGYSNFLWMSLLALEYVFVPLRDLYPLARASAFCFLALAGWSTYRLMRRHASVGFAAIGIITLAFSTDIVRAAQSGLETIPYTALLVLALLAYLEEPAGERRWSLFAMLPVALMRIDGFMPAGFVVAFELSHALGQRRFQPSVFLRWVFWPVALYLAYFAWRWDYYGLPLPTTYYAKQLVSTADPHRGINYARDALSDLGLLAALPFAALAIGRRPSRDTLLLVALCLCHVAYVIHVGGDWMPFWRFLLPIAPLVLTLFVWGLQQAWDATGRWRANRIARGALGLFLLAPCAFLAVRLDAHLINSPQEREKLDLAVHVKRHTRDNLLSAWPMLRWVLRRPGEKLVTDYGGVFSVFTDASIIEMWGLCNAAIALKGNSEGINPIYGKTCLPCYKDFNPDYFHVMVPLVREVDSFKNHQAVIDAVFQGKAIDRQINLRDSYVTGRVVESATGKALYFLERRRPGIALTARKPSEGIVVEYPFRRQRDRNNKSP